MIANSKSEGSGNLATLEPKEKEKFLEIWQRYIASNVESGSFRIGEQTFYANRFEKSSEIPWSVITVINADDYLHQIRKRTYESMLTGLVLCVFFAIFSSIFFGNISRRLKEIAIEMDRVGDLGIEQTEHINHTSIIREVNTMNSSLYKMKIALRSFTKYLPLGLVKTLVHSGNLAELGGEKKRFRFFSPT